MKLGRAIWLGVLLASAVSTASAGGVLKTMEASMLVTGNVDVNPDGSLHGYLIDHPEKLPPAVVQVINQNVAHWRFALPSTTNEVVHSTMSIRVRAKPDADGNYHVSLVGASFGDNLNSEGEAVSYKSREPAPRYPGVAVLARASGTVYLLLRIGRDGAVQEAISEQVDLDQYGSPADMGIVRKSLANASVEAARQWTFNLPTRGKRVNDPYWVVRVPVNFGLGHLDSTPSNAHPYGSWINYFPGPRQSPPWTSKSLLSEAPDAMPGGGLHSDNAGLELATPVGSG